MARWRHRGRWSTCAHQTTFCFVYFVSRLSRDVIFFIKTPLKYASCVIKNKRKKLYPIFEGKTSQRVVIRCAQIHLVKKNKIVSRLVLYNCLNWELVKTMQTIYSTTLWFIANGCQNVNISDYRIPTFSSWPNLFAFVFLPTRSLDWFLYNF